MKKKRLLSWFLTMVMVLGLLPMTAWAETMPFMATAGEEPLEIEKSSEEYLYTVVTEYDENWNPVATEERTVPLYEVAVPMNVEEVTLDFGAEMLAYAYDEDGNYVAAYAKEGDYANNGQTGERTAVIADGFGNFVRVQTPYDENWNSTFEYAITFIVEEFHFSVTIDGEAQEITKADDDYEYTVVLEYDENRNPIQTEKRMVTQYEVEVPADAEEIQFTFAEGRLAYGYDDVENYVASYGDYGDGTTGQKTAVITIDNLAEYVRVQTPYDSSWNSEVLYAVHLLTEDTKPSEPNEGEVSVESLLKNIAKSYKESEDGWIIMDMAAYEDLGLDSTKTSDTAKQKYINAAITSLNGEGVGETTYTKAILALTAIGIDAEELYPEDRETSINALAGLNALEHGSGAWVAPYTLMTYNQSDYEDTVKYENAVISAVLANQQEDGSWSEWGDSIQTTSNMIAGLAFYYDTNDAVKDALDQAVEYLSKAQQEDGSFDAYGSGADANTAAMVVIALSTLGINPDTEEDFIKNGKSVLDALLSFALTDNSGFGYTNNESLSSYATEQAFRALIAAKQVMETGKAFNIYDFSHNTELQPGYVKEVENAPVVPDKPKDEEITVKVSIKAIGEYWLKNKSVTIEEDSTVYDAFMEAIDDTGIEQEGAKKGYIESMTYDGETLGEFDEGDNSGWLYKVNGDLPDAGIKDYELEDGDEILFYYTRDWKKDHDADSRYEEEEEIIEEEIVEEELQEEVQPELQYPVLEELYADVFADNYYYEAARWAVAKGIASGVTETEFGAEWNCSRGQLMTLIWRLMGSPAPETQTAPYIDVGKDMYYHDAILWATENDLANGTDGISFSPEMTLTRGQAVTFLWRAAGMPEPMGKTGFVDVSEADYYYKAVLWAAEKGITTGTEDGLFSPNEPCTRGQIMTFLYRCFGK